MLQRPLLYQFLLLCVAEYLPTFVHKYIRTLITQISFNEQDCVAVHSESKEPHARHQQNECANLYLGFM